MTYSVQTTADMGTGVKTNLYKLQKLGPQIFSSGTGLTAQPTMRSILYILQAM